MALLTIFFTPHLLLTLVVVYFIVPYFLSPRVIRKIPGPFSAAFTNLWLLWQCRNGRRFIAVHKAHEKYGTFVRIQPNHISVADADSIQAIYGHGNGFLKSEYYDAFVSIRRGLFNTRDRVQFFSHSL